MVDYEEIRFKYGGGKETSSVPAPLVILQGPVRHEIGKKRGPDQGGKKVRNVQVRSDG